jgi:pimeloyl-ACP methyl ester carboxylesterase
MAPTYMRWAEERLTVPPMAISPAVAPQSAVVTPPAAPQLIVRHIPTDRLTVQITECPGRESAEPVLLIHGNVSSSVFWHDTMLDLPDRYRPFAPDLRGFGGTDPLPVDATRGVRDYSDDLLAHPSGTRHLLCQTTAPSGP